MSTVNNRQLVNDAIKSFTGRHEINLISPINNTVTQRRSFTPLVWHDSQRECYQSDYTQNTQIWTYSLQKFWKPLLWSPPNCTQWKEEIDRRISMQIDTASLRWGISTFCSVVRKVKPEFLHKPRRRHTVVNYVLLSQPLTRAVYTSQNSSIQIRERPVMSPR